MNIVKEKPPDIDHSVYKTIKCPLKSVLKNFDTIQPIIEKTVVEVNDIVILTYQFIRLYLLDKFNKKEPFPKITKMFVLDVMKTVSFCTFILSKTNCFH